MSIIESIVLAIVQGIAEFLPISSSAHLILFRDVLSIGSSMSNEMALAFDVALHLGTLLAIIYFFFKDFLDMFIEGMTKGISTVNGKIMWFIVIATIPGAIAGLLFEDIIENYFRSQTIIIALLLIVIGITIYLFDHYFENKKELKELTFKDVILIGLSQSLALFPGFSRSGTTIAIARSRGIKREEAAKFSFYLSVPIVLGAVILTFLKDNTIALILANLSVFIIGILVSFVTGLICIKFLLKYLAKNDFKLFMWYRIIIGILIILSVVF
jgi:undecaprenyl-diphosphatase